MGAKTVYTIGHSTHSLAEFAEMLESFDIQTLVDIRGMPGSSKFPHFNKEVLEVSMEEMGIHYLHLAGLGGRRKVHKDSKNTRWEKASFRGYADYMETAEFEAAAAQLEQIARKQRTAYMCAEAVWWRCHRSMVSDHLKAKGWTVMLIMAIGKAQEHRYTAPARNIGGKVFYNEEA